MYEVIPSTRFSSGVIVAHLTPTLCFNMALLCGVIGFKVRSVRKKKRYRIRSINGNLVIGLVSVFHTKIIVLEVDVEERKNEL